MTLLIIIAIIILLFIVVLSTENADKLGNLLLNIVTICSILIFTGLVYCGGELIKYLCNK